MAGRGRRFRPGPWVAPAALVGSLLLLAGALTAPHLTVWFSGGTCEPPGGLSVFGDLSVQAWPYGTVCTYTSAARPPAGGVVGPGPWWTLYLLAGAVGSVVAALVAARRRRATSTPGLPSRACWAWLPSGALGGAVAVTLLFVGLVVARAAAAQLAGDRAVSLDLARGIPAAVASGAVVGAGLGALVAVPAVVVSGAGLRRSWRTSAGSWAVLGASVAGPASMMVTLPLFGLLSEPSSGVMAVAVALGAGCAVVALAVGAGAYGLGRRMVGEVGPTDGRPVASAG